MQDSMRSDHGRMLWSYPSNAMKQISAEKFKTNCLALINQVKATGEPILITEHGKPVAKLLPAATKDDSIFGYMAGRAKIVGDIVSPITPIEDWDALK